MPEATFLPEGRRVEVAEGTRLARAAQQLGLRLVYRCGRRGLCGGCRVRVVSGMENLSERKERETETLTRLAAPTDLRLACQTAVLGDVTVEILYPAADIYGLYEREKRGER